MVPALAVLLLVQALDCPPGSRTLMEQARRAGEALDLQAAIAGMNRAAAGCQEAAIAASYLTGLQAARAAYRFGGDADSLAPVRAQEAVLMRYEEGGNAQAAIARIVLMAAAAAAQSERGDLQVLLDHALQLERVQLAAGAPGAPVVSAHEAAGDLWLQVHRFETARGAYRTAADVLRASTARIVLGLARTAVRLDDRAAACESYERLVGWTPRPGPELAEVAEARSYLSSSCGAP